MKFSRRTLFLLLLAAMPWLLLALVEGTFRIFSLFPRQPLFLEVSKEGRELFQLNTVVAQRYFNPRKVTVPNLFPETFARHKPAGTTRIFCLGGSTTAGFPFDYQVPFPAQLRYILSRQYPQQRFEVINLGLSAVNSFTVLDFIPEVLECEPDVIILYLGHNEFYGAYGSASAVSIGGSGGLIRFYLRLQKWHTVQMVRALVARLTPAAATDPDKTTLMEQVIADQKIHYASPKYRKTLANYQANLDLILRSCRRQQVPVLIGTLVANIRDLPPMGSSSRGDGDAGARAAITALTARCDQYIQQRAWQPALEVALQLMQQDSASAAAWYRTGKIYQMLGDSLVAGHYLLGARDRDLVRFRASGEINTIIARSASRHRAGLVDIWQEFSGRSPLGLPGNELICDHLHPNPDGYTLMAQAFAAAVTEAGLPALAASPAPGSDTAAPDDSVPTIAITDLDWDIGLLRIYKLMHRWPFAQREVDYAAYRPWGSKEASRAAYDYLFQHHNWVQAHYAMADHYTAQGQHGLARQEWLAVSSYHPERPEPLLKVAQSFAVEAKWHDAEGAWLAALACAPQKGMIYFQLALAQHRQKKLAAAIQNIQMAIVAPEMSAEQQSVAKYYLAGFFIDVGRKEYAAQVLQDVLNQNPAFKPALEMRQRYFAP